MLGDRTGPRGKGPRTGRGAGYCNGIDLPGYLNPRVNKGRKGRGLGAGPSRGGLGRGRGSSYSSRSLWSDGPPD